VLKLSNVDVLTGNQGQVRLNCSQIISSELRWLIYFII
jgi:hypothetical protein